MSKTTKRRSKPEMLAEYDFTDGERGKHARRYAEGTNVVVLDPDVAKAFPDPKVINDVLRSWATWAKARGRRLKK
jgi:hypothetical protein